MEPDDLLCSRNARASEGPRWTRAVEDHSAPIPERKRASLATPSTRGEEDWKDFAWANGLPREIDCTIKGLRSLDG